MGQVARFETSRWQGQTHSPDNIESNYHLSWLSYELLSLGV